METKKVEVALKMAGFIGPPLPKDLGGWRNYQAGEGFLQHLTFLGCSPHLRLAPEGDLQGFCFLRLADLGPQPRLIRGRETRPPRCPVCGKAYRATQEEYTAWQGGGTESRIHCPTCAAVLSPLDLRWRQTAGFGRCVLVVEDVFPGEAVPTPGFERTLQDLGTGEWQYFYTQGLQLDLLTMPRESPSPGAGPLPC